MNALQDVRKQIHRFGHAHKKEDTGIDTVIDGLSNEKKKQKIRFYFINLIKALILN